MIGDKIKELLALRGMKQIELARRTGIPKQTINSIITRNNKGVDFSVIEKIADALEVPIEYFYDRKLHVEGEEPAVIGELNEKERRFIGAFVALTPANRHTLLVIAEALLRDQSADSEIEE